MRWEIDGRTLTKTKSVPKFCFNRTQSKNIKNEIVNYKIKLESRLSNRRTLYQNYSENFIKPKKPIYVPTFRIIPVRTEEPSECIKIKSSEIILTSKLKPQESSRVNDTTNLNAHQSKTIYKARSTLKNFNYIINSHHKNQNPLEKKSHNFSTTPFFFQKQLIKNEQGNSLCSLLNQKKKDFIDSNFEKNEDCYSDLLKTKQAFYKKENYKMTYYLNKLFESDKDIPIFLDPPLASSKKFNSESEKERNFTNTKKFEKLKYFLIAFPDKRKALIKEFLIKNYIYNTNYFTKENLEKFAYYVLDNEAINYSLPIQEILDIALTKTKDAKTETRKSRRRTKKILQKSYTKWDSCLSSNLVSNLSEQTKLYSHQGPKTFSITKMSENDIENLEKELSNLNNIKLKNKSKFDNTLKRLYYEIKQKEHDDHPELLPKKRHKLLEYIVLNQARAVKDFKRDLLENKIEEL